MKWICSILIGVFLSHATPALPSGNSNEFRTWILDMKLSSRGPFSRIRWFCNDGSILEPKPYACRDSGGGFQHGEWTDRVKTIRAHGFFVANIYAGLDSDLFFENKDHIDILKQMILEQFLINADDGWIFRNARYYRGALQTEGESAGGQALLEHLLKQYQSSKADFLMLREAVRLIPHHHQTAPVSQMRQLSLSIAEMDESFIPLRIKLHVRPEASDAGRVRVYSKKSGKPEFEAQYQRLARTIDQVFAPKDLSPVLLRLAGQAKAKDFSSLLVQGAEQLATQTDLLTRFKTASQMVLMLRTAFNKKENIGLLLPIMDVSNLLEHELFRLSADLPDRLSDATVRQLMDWLNHMNGALYGTGFLSDRQYAALKERLNKSVTPGQTLLALRNDMIYLSKASDWAQKNLSFTFSRTIDHFQTIEPLSKTYVHDRLHTSMLLIYSHLLDRLMIHNSRQLNLANDIFDQKLAMGIKGLNPGLARGILKEPKPGEDLSLYSTDDILILPATTADLPPVAGIITAGRGNILSHVQLLARNLGIPNISVGKERLTLIRSGLNQNIVMAVSPKGIVQLTADNPEWDPVFRQKIKTRRQILAADTQKLALDQLDFISLGNIRSTDSGRVAGPKAANLGELKHHFPDAVTDGVVIPFGRFRQLLDRPKDLNSAITMFEWMKSQYNAIEQLNAQPAEQKKKIEQTLSYIRSWIMAADPGDVFKKELKQMLDKTLGPDGSYGVFVRSDTNVEDLPGFTGAGLNLTVPHVVGFDNILLAIRRVWASPFTLRSFSWRHAFLENPEHVYTSVLLMKTVPVEKSGVMITKNLDTGQYNWLTIAVNEGVGGAVSGQTAEELQIDMETHEVTLLAQATEPLRRIVFQTGGMGKTAASGTDTVLTADDIEQLIRFAQDLPDRFPILKDQTGKALPADVEFGFLNNKMVLFQIRPLVDDVHTSKNQYLLSLDQQFENKQHLQADLNTIPGLNAIPGSEDL